MRYAIYVKADRGIRALQGLKKHASSPVVCISEQEDRAICDFCKREKIPFVVEDRPKKKAHIDLIHEYNPDLIVCAGYSRMLPESLFSGLDYGAINCHGGKLPEYRGASPIPWQIMQNETQGVAYVLKMTKGVDDGPILSQERYKIEANDTARHITDKVAEIFERIIPVVVNKYEKNHILKATAQIEEGTCYWTRRIPQDGLIQWEKLTALEVVNLARALDDPYPGAYLMRHKSKYILRRVRVCKTLVRGVPGRFVGKTSQGALILASDRAVEILEFIHKGKIISGTEFPARYGEDF